jgi:nucleotide-binding universal stress UspA family protein
MRKIVVPTDFSVSAYNALELAKKIAQKTHGKIYLVHVIEHFADKYSGLESLVEADLDQAYTVQLNSKIQFELDTLQKANSSELYEIQTKLLFGKPFPVLKIYIDFIGPDLVIIGAKGSSNAEEPLLGSLTDKVVRSMTYPVITVKNRADVNEITNIVYATDLEKEHQALINTIKELQSLFDSQIHIVKINTQKKFKNDIDTKVELRRLADKNQLENYTVNCYSHEDEEYGIVYFADEKEADLIVMGIEEKSGIRRLITGGSLADEVSDHTFRPILTHRFQKDV